MAQRDIHVRQNKTGVVTCSHHLKINFRKYDAVAKGRKELIFTSTLPEVCNTSPHLSLMIPFFTDYERERDRETERQREREHLEFRFTSLFLPYCG